MELRHLRYFVTLAKLLNFTKAAAKLHVAQPALSRQIRDLEDELGVQLLERNSRFVRLTAAGATFVHEARAVLDRAQEERKPRELLLRASAVRFSSAMLPLRRWSCYRKRSRRSRKTRPECA
jgi:DNA-binding transcriptional LysR family regulator